MSEKINTGDIRVKQYMVLVPGKYKTLTGDDATDYMIYFIGSETAAKQHQRGYGWQCSIIAEVNAVYGADGELRAEKK